MMSSNLLELTRAAHEDEDMMSSTLLELTRAAHEDVERMERLIVKDLQKEPASNRDRLFQSHRVRHLIDEITSTTHKLIEIYEDNDSAMKDEIATLGDQTAAGTNVSGRTVLSTFDNRFLDVREHHYHRRHPSASPFIDADDEYEQLLQEEPQIEFSGEEAFGRYLDMHELYNDYINSKFGKQIDYSTYLQVLLQPQKSIPQKLKTMRRYGYRKYLSKMLDYLVYFFERTQPLQDLDRLFSKVSTEFEERWSNGKVQGWKDESQENGHVPDDKYNSIDLDYYTTVEELVELGPEKLKEALATLGLKTGGTVQQRAERLFLTKHTPLEKLDRKHFAKGSPQQGEDSKEIALMEAKIEKLCELLRETIVRTKENVEKKQALTYEEMEAEREDDEEVLPDDIESDDEERQTYNPLKLPMGWDGKPIPYWLYKLHGLGHEFKCEICGNSSYWGRRAYEHHFKESRHQYGMHRLGISNTKSFNEITLILEAQNLWEKIKEKQGVNKWRPDLEEEYEDQEGNIYNKKTYTDLLRQGLI